MSVELSAPSSTTSASPAVVTRGASNAIVRAIEVTQSIQSIDNDVRLIADKATVMRVYLDPAIVPNGVRLAGEAMWRRSNGGMFYLPSMNRVTFGPNAPSLLDQRIDVEKSLNFALPKGAIRSGRLELALNRVFVPGGDEIVGAGPLAIDLEFERAPVMRVRAIGLRYKRPNDTSAQVSPDAVHFSYMRSYLMRAYPIGALDWSQIVIDADHLSPPFDGNASDIANAQLSLIRTNDLAAGFHPTTRYYGLVDNDRGAKGCTIRGSAVLDSATNTFEFVACGPSGRPNGWAGDEDGSFADWYSAHELGHTCQRRHPGFPNVAQNLGGQPRDPADLPGFPYPDGRISSADNRYVGFDVGDPALGLPMQSLRGDLHHDFMTYSKDQWVCKYTYDGIYERLLAESHLYK